MAIGIRAAQEAFKNNFWVAYQFDSQGYDPFNSTAAITNKRVVAWAQEESFTWHKFVNGHPQIFYNTDWSLKRWYQWGQRNFHLHMPFGKPVLENIVSAGQNPLLTHPEHLAYQPDAFLCARDGFGDIYADQYFFNTPMRHLTDDFEKVWKALTTGTQGELTDQQWYEITQWFNPTDPIKVIVYNGSISDSMFYRWSNLFNSDYDSALQRLKDSVQPFINCGMRIGFDALTVTPGPISGRLIPFYKLSRKAQEGWWEFYTWLEEEIGPENIYMEAHPYKRVVYSETGVATEQKDPNPYIGRGIGVLCEDESSYFNAELSPDYHYNSELGKIHYLRAINWSNLHGPPAPKTLRLNNQLAFARYPMFEQYSTIMKTARSTNLPSDVGEHRIIFRIQNAYGQGMIHEIAAIGLTQRFYQEQDPNSINDRTRFGFIIDHARLQRFATSQIPSGQTQFIDRFPDSRKFIQYLAAYNPPTLSTGETVVSPPASE
jgi:hypothetical protein